MCLCEKHRHTYHIHTNTHHFCHLNHQVHELQLQETSNRPFQNRLSCFTPLPVERNHDLYGQKETCTALTELKNGPGQPHNEELFQVSTGIRECLFPLSLWRQHGHLHWWNILLLHHSVSSLWKLEICKVLAYALCCFALSRKNFIIWLPQLPVHKT